MSLLFGISQEGYYLFKLDAFSESKTKSAHIEQVISLKETEGKITFFTKTYFDTASISIDGSSYKKIALSHSSSEAPGTLALKMGMHTLEGEYLIYFSGFILQNYHTHWKYEFEVKPNFCNNIEAFRF